LYHRFKEDLGNEYEVLRSKLRSILGEDEVWNFLENLELSVCSQCGVREVDAEVEDLEDNLELHVEASAEDYTCLPRMKGFEKLNTII
jgi:hypothetical protein